ncbi:TetR/AcrR family transcriptional regulator [Microbispora bryophytorum]|uniref:TetR/AcrR family transcriptional regulator n=1 Tax=Microbispora bryophytorum TaxID=1460882 RepID=UPI0033ED5910
MPGRGSGEDPPRRTARGAATRERIIATAADLMHRQGVTATTLDQVVDTCGVSKSQLYHYFPDKEALVAEVIATQANRVLSAQKQLLEQLHTMQELDKWRDALVSGLSERGYRCPIGSQCSEVAAEDLALEVVAALQGGYLLAETMQDEQPFVLALDMALGWVKAHARADHQKRPDRPG